MPATINKFGAYICAPCSEGRHLGTYHNYSQHALCQCDGKHDSRGNLRRGK